MSQATKTASWWANHWALTLNTFFFTYAALPMLAPILLAQGYAGPAEVIYQLYGFTCHQMPDHSHFIAGQQMAVCQRCNAIQVTLALAGLIYASHLFRLPALNLKWFLLFLIPIGIDGGMALVSDLLTVMPVYPLWIVGLTLIAISSLWLYSRRLLSWPVALFFAAGPFSLLYLQLFGPHSSNWWLRAITGAIYAVGVIWLIYSMFEPKRNET